MGLTLAEVMVLILFALLLVIGWTYESKSDNEKLGTLVRKVLAEKKQGRTGGTDDFDDTFRELILQAEVGQAVTAALRQTDKNTIERQRGTLDPERAARLVVLGQAVAKAAVSDTKQPLNDDTEKRAADLIQVGAAATETLGENRMALPKLRAATETLEIMKREYEKNSSEGSSRIWLEKLLAQAELASGNGNGTEYPPCIGVRGDPGFIYNVTLTSNSIRIHDNQLPTFEDLRQRIPMQPLRFDADLARAEFLATTRPLFDWSKSQDCRFFVRVFDSTAAHEKQIYKLQLRTVEQHFYKYEPLGPVGVSQER